MSVLCFPCAAMCLWHRLLACGWLPSLLPEVESLAQEVYARERKRELGPSVPLQKKKKQRQREPVLEKIIACNSVVEPSKLAIIGRCGGAALARHGARGMQGGIQFQPLHFCAHCEGQTLTGTISLPSPILCLPASALTQQCSYTDL